MSSLFSSESKFMERSRVALTNGGKHAKIKPALAEYGMDDAEISEGWKLHKQAEAALELNAKEGKESKIASMSYRKAYDALQPLFKRHRDHTLIFFRKKPELLIQLGVQGRFPIRYTDFFDKTKQFYKGIKDNKDLQTEVLKIKITLKVVNDCLAKHKILLEERAKYDKELGESQDSTVSKNIALLELKEWMDDFDDAAKVALYDTPQLLEVLGIFVRS